MPYEYFCRACDAVSPTRRERRGDAENDGAEHRQAVHGGLAPAAGDGVRRVHADARGDGLLPRNTGWALLFLLFLILANCWGPHH